MTDAKKKAASKSSSTQKRLTDAKKEVDHLRDLAARAQADLQNAKQRLEREKQEISRYACESLLKKLLPTLDNLQRALAHFPKHLRQDEWIRGVESVEQDLFSVLQEVGLERMSSLEEKIDPNRHDVLVTGPGEEGKVIEVLEEGYELHGKVLRPAKVKTGDGSN